MVEDLRLHQRREGHRVTGTCASRAEGRLLPQLHAVRPRRDRRARSSTVPANPIKSDDGCDIIYGDDGNDWLVGGTDTNWLFGGFGDDLLQSSQNLETDNEHNKVPEPALWSAPTFAYGGAGRDVLIADTGRARMFDWTGEFNSFIVPFSPFGKPGREALVQPVHTATSSPPSRSAGGQDQTFAPQSPLDETALSTPQDSFWNDQHGGPRDPQPGQRPRRADRLPRSRGPRLAVPLQPRHVDRGRRCRQRRNPAPPDGARRRRPDPGQGPRRRGAAGAHLPGHQPGQRRPPGHLDHRRQRDPRHGRRRLLPGLRLG